MLTHESMSCAQAPYAKINTMYHMHTLGASKCMHVVHSVGGFAFGGGFGYTYLN